jgi:hypothetical protein
MIDVMRSHSAFPVASSMTSRRSNRIEPCLPIAVRDAPPHAEIHSRSLDITFLSCYAWSRNNAWMMDAM